MTSMRSWSWILLGLVASATVGMQACSNSERAPEPAAPTRRPANAPTPARPAETADPDARADELSIDIAADPDEGLLPLTVNFKATVKNATGTVTCDWDFGDGTPHGADLQPSHVYQSDKDFIVTLKCKDSRGIEGEAEIDILAYKE